MNRASGVHGLRTLLMRQPVGGVARRAGFGALAVVLVVAELVSGGGPGQLGAFTIEWLITGYGLLALTGWLPATGGLLYTIATCLAILAPSDTLMVVFPLIGVFAVAGDWISRSWYLPAVLVLAATNAADVLLSDSRSTTFLGAFLGICASIGVGSGLRWNSTRLTTAHQEAESARRAAETAQMEVRREIAATLHDTVVADLVRLLVASQSLTRTTTDPQAAEDSRALTSTARDAMVHLRALMSSTLPDQSSQPEPLTQVIATCQTMLQGRSITLDTEVPPDLGPSLTRRQRALVALVVREAATNILKYARAGTHADLTIETPPDGGIAILATNQIDPARDHARATLGGGFGLDNLTAQVAREGGTLQYGSRGASWLLAVLIPATPSDQGGDSLPASSQDTADTPTRETTTPGDSSASTGPTTRTEPSRSTEGTSS
ncbi:MAG: hypothetical protein LKI58_09130 [Actinomyces sp.]|nr:hypothetical protein [Actinomyces sp.]MCI1788214.1 hypothetical protein [Actinomyces sp.]MCI1830055.1 hypothetical protein [Actinomyces sp.]MCI1866494.1 hypothetical protein [Actinomyces sp.]